MVEVEMKRVCLEYGFFHYPGNGKLYFGMPHGKMDFHFPVKDGKICRQSDGSSIFPVEMISVIPLQEMANYGMQIKQGDNPMDQRFWS